MTEHRGILKQKTMTVSFPVSHPPFNPCFSLVALTLVVCPSKILLTLGSQLIIGEGGQLSLKQKTIDDCELSSQSSSFQLLLQLAHPQSKILLPLGSQLILEEGGATFLETENCDFELSRPSSSFQLLPQLAHLQSKILLPFGSHLNLGEGGQLSLKHKTMTVSFPVIHPPFNPCLDFGGTCICKSWEKNWRMNYQHHQHDH